MAYQYRQLPSGLLDIVEIPETVDVLQNANQSVIDQPDNLLMVQEPIRGSGQQALAAQQAARAAHLASLTPGEVAAENAMAIPNLVNFLTPLPIKVLMQILGVPAFGSTSSGGLSASSGSPMAGIGFKGNIGQVANAVTTASNAAAAGGRGSGPGGMTGSIGIGGGATSSGMGTGIGGLGGIGGGL